MKNLIVLLVLVISMKANAQTFFLKFKSFHLYDTINHKYAKGIKGSFTCYVDMDKKNMKIVDDKDGEEIYNFDILSVKAYDKTLANHCIRSADNSFWDVYQVTTSENRILKGKSGRLGWIFKTDI